jgi:hypothetical protein
MDNRAIIPAQATTQLGLSFITARAVYVAAKLGIADQLCDGPKNACDLARAVRVDADALSRVMRLLAGAGIFRQGEPDLFSLTDIGETLKRDSAQSVRDYIVLYHELLYPVFGNMMHRVLTGESAQLKTFGKPVFELVRENGEFAAVFYSGLASRAKIDIAVLLEAYDFSDATAVVDIGGGNGGLLAAILARYEHLSGILFDLEPAITAARADRTWPLSRCEFVPGDFFETIPTGADIYLLKLVLHDWGNDDAARILKQCRQAVTDSSRLLIIEGLIGRPNELTLTNLVDLTMLLGAHAGRERTEAEFATLLERCGFRLRRTIPTKSALYILEATPV